MAIDIKFVDQEPYQEEVVLEDGDTVPVPFTNTKREVALVKDVDETRFRFASSWFPQNAEEERRTLLRGLGATPRQ